jgi:hypothetical protein
MTLDDWKDLDRKAGVLPPTEEIFESLDNSCIGIKLRLLLRRDGEDVVGLRRRYYIIRFIR